VTNQYVTADEYRATLLSMPNKSISDSALDGILQVATEEVEKYTERVFASAYYTEVFRGDGSRTHLVYEYPIISITSLIENTIANPPVTLTYPSTTRLLRLTDNDAHGRIELDGLDTSTVSFGGGAVYTLIYRGGYLTIPAGVRHATSLWAAELLRQNYGMGSALPEVTALTSEQIVELLNPIRRRRI